MYYYINKILHELVIIFGARTMCEHPNARSLLLKINAFIYNCSLLNKKKRKSQRKEAAASLFFSHSVQLKFMSIAIELANPIHVGLQPIVISVDFPFHR